MITNDAKQELIRFGQRLQNAKHGAKAVILNEAMEYFGWSRDTFYRNLDKLGWESGNKARKDKGSTGQDVQALEMLAAMSKTSARANGKILIETTDAISVLSQNGYTFKSPSTVNRLLRQRNLTAKQTKQDTTHGHFKSLHPNHVHLADASMCVLYYPPGKKKGMRVQKYTTIAEQYKNKPEALEKIKKLRVWRYVMVDHYSGLITVKYFECAGENQQVLYDLLLFGWGKKTGSPFHGLPRFVYWDKGSAMTSKAIKHALGCLNVEHVAHATHLARATGAVEKANDIVEKRLEGRLLFEPVNSVDELNEVALKWQNAYNANLIPHYNSAHSRSGMARTDAWLKIMRADNIQHLRALPSLEYCRYIFTHEPVTRTVGGDLEISFRHPVVKKSLTYSLANLEGVHAKQKVLVSPLVVGEEAKVLVTVSMPIGDDVLHEVAPMAFDEAGFRVDSPVFGEGFDTKKDTVIDSNQKTLDRVAYPGLNDEEIDKAKKKKTTPFNGEIDALSHITRLDLPAAITPKGETFAIPEQFTTAAETRKPMSSIDIKIAVTNALGRDLDGFEFDILAGFKAIYPEDIAAIVTDLHNGTARVAGSNVVSFK